MANEQKNEWGNNRGLVATQKNGGRWDAWSRLILSFMLGAISAVYIAGGKSRDISDLLTWKGETQETLKRMDRDGTNRSRWVDEAQSGEISANKAEITKLKERTEQITVLQGKFERLEGQFEDYKAAHK